jgi:hypothetical protein
MIESNLDPWPVQALEATLGLPTASADAPVDLPPLWHWLYFLPTAPRNSIGPDGHMVSGLIPRCGGGTAVGMPNRWPWRSAASIAVAPYVML